MATILKATQRDFKESPNKIDNYRIFTDVSRINKGLNPENLNFDFRQFNPLYALEYLKGGLKFSTLAKIPSSQGLLFVFNAIFKTFLLA